MIKFFPGFILISMIVLSIHVPNAAAENLDSIGVTVPSYAKWGRIAMQKTKERYPEAQIVDYLHIGREDSDGYSTEKFKLWLKGSNKEFGVLINIRFDSKTEELKQISFKEVSR
ncbi:YqzG/YhdC family protein [Rossellomorea aquimaris]|uniref:YqzG/YhdC family protein n=1 Tax=Rossellomorea aquimaris TaxID=189382 RepID=UPI001CD7CF7E|nr:YqzG/YhdC family protein [Rossellomorea aquimaris]MCA1053772.1 YqzG/YhdC family protein [Rossellomorea aquimaris]